MENEELNKEEIEALGLSGKQGTPFRPPQDYFLNLQTRIIDKIEDKQVLEAAPHLTAIGTGNVFHMPDAYLETLPIKVLNAIPKKNQQVERPIRRIGIRPKRLAWGLSIAAAVLFVVMGVWGISADSTNVNTGNEDYWSLVEQTEIDAYDIAEVFDLTGFSMDEKALSDDEVSDLLDQLDNATFELGEAIIEGI